MRIPEAGLGIRCWRDLVRNCLGMAGERSADLDLDPAGLAGCCSNSSFLDVSHWRETFKA
jgi:hypothetical protein